MIIAPDDIQIITGGSEERRRFLDALLSQLDAAYLQHLIDYNKVLQQRNSFLKSLAEKRQADTGLLDVYDEQLGRYGNYVHEKRKSFLQEFIPAVQNFTSRSPVWKSLWILPMKVSYCNIVSVICFSDSGKKMCCCKELREVSTRMTWISNYNNNPSN